MWLYRSIFACLCFSLASLTLHAEFVLARINLESKAVLAEQGTITILGELKCQYPSYSGQMIQGVPIPAGSAAVWFTGSWTRSYPGPPPYQTTGDFTMPTGGLASAALNYAGNNVLAPNALSGSILVAKTARLRLVYQNIGSYAYEIDVNIPAKLVRYKQSITNGGTEPQTLEITYPDGSKTLGVLAAGDTYYLDVEVEPGKTVSAKFLMQDYEQDPVTGEYKFKEGAVSDLEVLSYTATQEDFTGTAREWFGTAKVKYAAPKVGSTSSVVSTTTTKDAEGNVTSTTTTASTGVSSSLFANEMKSTRDANAKNTKDILGALENLKPQKPEKTDQQAASEAADATALFIDRVKQLNDGTQTKGEEIGALGANIAKPNFSDAQYSGSSIKLGNHTINFNPSTWEIGGVAISTILGWVRNFILIVASAYHARYLMERVSLLVGHTGSVAGGSGSLAVGLGAQSGAGFNASFVVSPVVLVLLCAATIGVFILVPTLLLQWFRADSSFATAMNALSSGASSSGLGGAIYSVVDSILPVGILLLYIIQRAVFSFTVIPIQVTVTGLLKILQTA